MSYAVHMEEGAWLDALKQWFDRPLGQALLAAEQVGLNQILPKLFGYYLIQLGISTYFNLLKISSISCKARVTPEECPTYTGPIIRADLNDLPFLPSSVDVIILPHVLEFLAEPQALLKDVEEMLIAEGNLIIFSFNPLSLSGFSKLFRRRQIPPWSGRFLTAFRLCRWLNQLGFTITLHKTFFFRPLVRSPSFLKKLLFFESVGQLCWPNLGATFMLVAKKRSSTLTPVRRYLFPSKRSRVKQGYPEPTTRI